MDRLTRAPLVGPAGGGLAESALYDTQGLDRARHAEPGVRVHAG